MVAGDKPKPSNSAFLLAADQPRTGLPCIVVPVVDDPTWMNSLPGSLSWGPAWCAPAGPTQTTAWWDILPPGNSSVPHQPSILHPGKQLIVANALSRNPLRECDISEGERLRADNMNKLIIITLLVSLVALSAESFRLPRQAVEEKTDILTKITDGIKISYEELPGKNLRLKAENLFNDVTMGAFMYMYMIQERIYYLVYPEQ
ncbi:unnamed protein product [Arctogadus glacialis]